MKRKTEQASPGRARPAGRKTPAASGPARVASARAPLTPLTPDIEAELAAIAAGAGCELLAAEWKAGTLRLILDRPEAPFADGAETAEGRSLHTSVDSSVGPSADAGAGTSVDARAGAATGDAGQAAAGYRAGQAAASYDAEQTAADSGVSLGDCEHVARQASALLDVADFGGGRYVLEVSSPGLDRALYRPSDYRRFRGRLARVTFDDPATGGKRTLVGRLDGLDEAAGSVTLALEAPAEPAAAPRKRAVEPATAPRNPAAPATGARLAVIPLNTIRLARLEIELERNEKKKR
jgi:ribosome maturation factor RimP